MASTEDTRNPSSFKPIIARTLLGDELALNVTERCSLIVIQSKPTGHELIMAYPDAIELTLELIEAIFRQHRRGEAGPFSASY